MYTYVYMYMYVCVYTSIVHYGSRHFGSSSYGGVASYAKARCCKRLGDPLPSAQLCALALGPDCFLMSARSLNNFSLLDYNSFS